MKKPLLAVLGVAGACAACCAIPLAIPLLGGLSLAGAGFISWGAPGAGPAWLILGVGALVTAVLTGMWMRRRNNACPAQPAQSGAFTMQPADKACAIAGDDPHAQPCACAPSKT